MSWLDRLLRIGTVPPAIPVTKGDPEPSESKAALPPSPPVVLMGAQGVVESPFGVQGFWPCWPDQVPFAVPTGDFNYYSSSLVRAAYEWLGRQMKSPPPQLQLLQGDEYENVPESPFLDLLARPNKFYSGERLFNAFAQDWIIQGNVYWKKVRVRGDTGPVDELWPLPARDVLPVTEGEDFITAYEYSSRNGGVYRYPVSEVIHFRNGVDPDDPRLGYAPVKSCTEELIADHEAARYSAYMLVNRGGVPFAVCPEPGPSPATLDAAKLKSEIVAAFAGGGKFDPLVISRPVRFHDFHYGPNELDVSGTRNQAEARFCAVMGISPMVLDLQVGLEHSTYSNKEQAERAAWTDFLVPTLDYVAGELREQLLLDFIPNYEDYWVAFDYSQVKGMREDQTALYSRITQGYTGGWLKQSEARSQASYQSGPEEDQYKPAPASPMQFGSFDGGGRKRLDVWDDTAIAAYFRALAPDQYDGLITAGKAK